MNKLLNKPGMRKKFLTFPKTNLNTMNKAAQALLLKPVFFFFVMFLLVNLPSSVCLFSGSASNRQVWFAHSISPPKNFVYQIHHPATSAPSTHQRIWGASQILLPFHTSYSLSYWSVQMYCRQHQLAKDTNGQSSCCCFNQCPFVAVTNGRHFPMKNISNGFLRRWFRLV